MRTLTNGIRVPEDGDAGNVWSDALEYDMEQLDATIGNLQSIAITDIAKPTQTIDSANWTVDLGGKGYKQTVSMPAGLDLSKTIMKFRVTSGPKVNKTIYPTIEPLSLTSFDLIVNDNTLNLEILYS
jgi:hypothetical protein